MTKTSEDCGFTLLEVVVAIAILAIAFGSLFPIFGSGLGRIKSSDERFFAVALAESKLRELLVIKNWNDLPQSGEEADWQWMLTRTPDSVEKAGPLLLQVEVAHKTNRWVKPIIFNRTVWDNG